MVSLEPRVWQNLDPQRALELEVGTAVARTLLKQEKYPVFFLHPPSSLLLAKPSRKSSLK